MIGYDDGSRELYECEQRVANEGDTGGARETVLHDADFGAIAGDRRRSDRDGVARWGCRGADTALISCRGSETPRGAYGED